MSIAKLRVRGSGQVSAKTFFEDVCPVLLKLRAPLCQELGGRYGFRLGGSFAGSWTIDFQHLRVEPAISEVDLLVEMTTDNFERFIAGKLDPISAIATNKLRFSGDRSLFMNLSAFSQPVQEKEYE